MDMMQSTKGAAVLCLDFDGVLHPADDAVLIRFEAPTWQLALQLRTQGRLVWLTELEQALQGTQARILVHSTWRQRLSDAALRELLGESLGERLLQTDHWIEPQARQALPHCAYIREALQAYTDTTGQPVASLCIVDDRPQLFEDWTLLQPWSPTCVWVNGATGLSDTAARAQLRAWAQQAS